MQPSSFMYFGCLGNVLFGSESKVVFVSTVSFAVLIYVTVFVEIVTVIVDI